MKLTGTRIAAIVSTTTATSITYAASPSTGRDSPTNPIGNPSRRGRLHCPAPRPDAVGARLRLEADEAAGEGAGVEGAEVVGAFAHADEMDGEAEPLRDRHQHAAARGAVDL